VVGQELPPLTLFQLHQMQELMMEQFPFQQEELMEMSIKAIP
jgi:hypothetical protein